MNKNYDDIINLPHHVSTSRPQMPMADRAAQFSPFAALVGYESEIDETAQLVSMRYEQNGQLSEKNDKKFNQ